MSTTKALAYKPNLRLGHNDYDILVRTVWLEARGQSVKGQMAVVDVVLNRIVSKDPIFANDKTVPDTCKRAGQFSGWKLEHPYKLKRGSVEYEELLNTVELAYVEWLHGVDYSKGATFYCTKQVHPKWLKSVRATTTIGKHRFFKPLKRPT